MNIYDVLVVAEFRGNYPDVPFAEGVDYDTLIAGDEQPFFVTLPVAEVDAVSGNKRYYDRGFVQDLARQISQKRPVGNMGHLPDEQRATSFPMPAGHWVGAKMEGNVLWGKAYIPPGEVREFVRRMKATGSKIATSIYGTGEQVWNAARDAFAVSKFNLESIDFAPADRAGVSSLAAVPLVTSEMMEGEEDMGDTTPQVQVQPVNRVQIIGEMTAEEVRYLPDAVRNAVLSQSAESKVVSELVKITGVEANELGKMVTELVQERDAIRRERVNTAIERTVAETIMPNVTQITDRVKSARQTVAELVKARNPQDEATVKSIVAEIAGQDFVKSIVEAATIAEMGPNRGSKINTDKGDGEGQGEFLKPKPEVAK